MRKVLVANVTSKVTNELGNDSVRNLEFELTELNQHLADGWNIEKYDIVTSQIAICFSIIYQLHKV